MKTLVNLIRLENFEQEVIAEKRPVLLLCMQRDEEYPKQLKLMEDIAERYINELKVCVLQEETIEPFKKSYSILGTPTFLIMREGKERRRMLGLADQETLINLISNFQ